MKKFWKCILWAVLISVVLWVFWANTALEMNTIVLQEENLPLGFDGFRIAHISDFHSAVEMTDSVISKLESAKPDMICITGDLISSGDKTVETALNFAGKAAEIAPCYFVTGNHENMVSEALYTALLTGLKSKGVIALADEQVILEKDDAQIALVGHFWGDTHDVGNLSDFTGYRILLSHQPEAIADYAAAGYELVLAGHAHGGQFRLPFVGGVYAPGQGIFPEYDAGVHSRECTDMVISRGIGNSVIPLRFHNRPEVIVVELKCLTSAA